MISNEGVMPQPVEKTWANQSLGANAHETLRTFQKRLPVGLIATDRSAFETCGAEEEVAQILERNRHKQFDFLPVTEQASSDVGTRDSIIGLIEIAPLMHDRSTGGLVRTRMRHLSEENLIGADASILAFIRDADRQRCRLIILGQDISGLVSLSDLQRLPVRAAIFGLVTHLEILMAGAIRSEFRNPEDWLKQLSENRRQKLRNEIDKAHKGNDFVDALLFTQFADKVTIIRRSSFVVGKNDFENEFKQIQSLRDHLAHANDYAATSDAASKVCNTVRTIEKWNEKLMTALTFGG